MKRILLIFLFLGNIFFVSGYAQNNGQPAEKPSTNACPTWNNKTTKSKADYFMYLRKSPKAAKTTEIARYNQRNKDFNKPVYTSLIPQKAIPAKEPEQEEKTEMDRSLEKQEIPSLIPNIDVKTLQTKETKPDLTSIPETININKENEASDSASGVKTIEVKKKSTRHFVSFHNKERKHWFRKLKLRKKGAAKCPDF